MVPSASVAVPVQSTVPPTLMVVTHDPAIDKRADRIIEIRDGLIEKDSRAA